MPRVRCNLLMTKPFAPALPAGMACALSESGDRTESREGADAVIEAPCDTPRRVPRWTGGHRCTARELAPWNGGCKEEVMAKMQGVDAGQSSKAVRPGGFYRCRSDDSRNMPLPVCSCS